VRPFTYERAASVEGAVRAVAGAPNAKFIGGGTNLLDLMKLEIERPAHLVDVSRLPLAQVTDTDDGGLHIGAMATNTQVAADPRVRARYPLLTQAIVAGASAQLRNKATTAGNLLQRTRCPYFYDSSKPCNKREPGAGCAALEGLNGFAAILGASQACIAAHPSDMAVAIRALDGTVETATAEGAVRAIPMGELHRAPQDTPHLETTLAAGELITGVRLPPPPPARTQLYRKVRDRGSFAFGLTSVALAGDRIVLGAVAYKPWRAEAAEAALASGATPGEAISAELAPARDAGHNGFKIDLVRRLVPAAMAQVQEQAA
jgi:xanthine dehydrogenase YagS FAD-binding subunit